jgi:tetratricopeptide (TPR) repeat protein
MFVARRSRGVSSGNRGEIALAFRQVAIVVALSLLGETFGCSSPVPKAPAFVPGIDPSDQQLTIELLELDRQIADLDRWLSSVPPSFESEEERRSVQKRWFAAVERASVLLNVDFDNPELFLRAGTLYRQGHFLKIPDTGASAYTSLNRCLALANAHVNCRYELARLLLALSPRYATTAEQMLVEARRLIEPVTRPEFEAALARAYLAQGRRSAALRQIEHYLTLRPEDLDAQRFRSTLIFESKRGTPLK